MVVHECGPTHTDDVAGWVRDADERLNSTDPRKVEADRRGRCCGHSLEDRAAAATLSGFRNHLWAWCPDLGINDRRNPSPSHSAAPLCGSTVHSRVFAPMQPESAQQRISRRERHFPSVSAPTPMERSTHNRFPGMHWRPFPRFSYRSPPQQTNRYHLAVMDRRL